MAAGAGWLRLLLLLLLAVSVRQPQWVRRWRRQQRVNHVRESVFVGKDKKEEDTKYRWQL